MASYAAAVGALHRPPAAPGPAAAARRPRRPARSAPLGAGARASLRSAGLLLAASLLALLAPPAAGSPLGAILGAFAGGGAGPAGAAPGPRPFDAAGGLLQGAGDEEAVKGAGEVALEDEDVVQDDRKLDEVTLDPSASPTTASPSSSPSMSPTTGSPSASPSASPTSATPSMSPTSSPTSSPTVCANDDSWRKLDKDRDCNYVALNPDKRCGWLGNNGKTANEACPVACGNCPSPAPTPTPPTPGPTVCANDDSWRKLDKDRDCNYVALNPDKRCGWPGNNGKTANEACPVACGNCPSPAPTPTPPTPGPTVCANDDSWRKLDKDRDCNYVALNPDKRCGWPGNNGKTANEACPVACGNCPSPAPTPTPPTPGPTLPLPTSAPTPCADDPTWHRKDKPSRDCGYVGLVPEKRCDWVDEDGKSASVACPVACGNCPSPAPTPTPPTPGPTLPLPTSAPTPCADDPTWHRKDKPSRDCGYAGLLPEKRCDWVDEDGKSASVACPVACGTCPALPSSAPTPTPPTPGPTICKDDPGWRKHNNSSRGCDYVKGNPGRRCTWYDVNNVLATQACPVACGTCP